MSLLDDARQDLFTEIAEAHGSLHPSQVEFVYDFLTNTGLIDYDIEKEVLLDDGDGED